MVFDFSKDNISQVIYRFARDSKFNNFQTVLSNSALALLISVPLGGKLARSVVSRVVLRRSSVVGSREGPKVGLGILRVERTVIRKNSNILVF